MTPDFYYGEMLRWSFGFENPNKAAVVFACLIPLLWAGWLGGFRLRSTGRKVFVLVLAAVGFLSAWGCLLLTFSRGGLVAAVSGMILITAWELMGGKRQLAGGWVSLLHRGQFWISGVLFALVIAAALLLGMGTRSLEAIGEDPSVGNRIELWSAALQMAYENPLGFGAGRSGMEFMQWYQDVDRTEGYRTMVNSYLTFLVEYGWGAFALLMIMVAAFWAWTWPQRNAPLARWTVALWGSLAAFLVSGIFSSTMEEPLVWIQPVLAVIGLIGLRIVGGRAIEFRIPRWAVAMGTVCIFLSCLFFTGMLKSSADSIQRTFASTPKEHKTIVAITPKTIDTLRQLVVYPDESVLGPNWGKLFQTLALATGGEVRVGHAADVSDGSFDTMLVGSSFLQNYEVANSGRVYLLAPTISDLPLTDQMILLLPEIDEDGRTRFWQDRVETMQPCPIKIVLLSGVGNRVEWAWMDIIENINSSR